MTSSETKEDSQRSKPSALPANLPKTAASSQPHIPAHPKYPGVLQQRLNIWLWNLISVGYRQHLEEHHLPELMPQLRAKTLAAKAEELWEVQVRKGKSHQALYGVLWALFRAPIIAGLVCNVCHGLLVGVARPFMLRRIITSVEDVNLLDALVLGIVLYAEATLQLWMKQLMADEVITGVFAACASMLAGRMPYVARDGSALTDPADQKSTQKKPDALVPEPTLIAQDLARTLENAILVYLVPSAFVQCAASCVMLLLFLGPSSLIGIGYCLVSLAISGRVARVNKKTDKKGLEAADKRVSTLRQILDGIKFIKLAAQEESYLEKMGELRKVESSHYRKFRSFEMTTAALGRLAGCMASMLTFVLLALAGQPLKPAEIFASLSIFLSLRLPLGVIPSSFVLVNSISLSIARINQSLTQPRAEKPALPEKESISGSMVDAEFRYSSEGAPALHSISFSVSWGQMVAVVGAVASGKSTLLTGLLGGLAASKGRTCLCSDAIAYVPQRPVVFSGTVLMNITMGHQLDTALLASVLEAASFARDLEMMPHGLATEIGERGTTLSGGQQTRLNIARAFYQQPRLLVADDPLAAVDVHVASSIFAAMQQWMRSTDIDSGRPGRTVVMAMNQLHLLPDFDHVLYLEGNTIAVQGSPAEIEAAASARPNLAQLLESARAAMSVDDIDVQLSTCDNQDFDACEKQAAKLAEETAKKKGESAASSQRLSVLAMTAGNENKAARNNLVKVEHRQRGRISQSIWAQYLRAVGCKWATIYAGNLFLAYGLLAANDWWLAHWMQKTKDGVDDKLDCLIYATLSISHSVMLVALAFVSGFAGQNASRHLHRIVLSNILRAPVSWFEETPSGRTLSRFSSDLLSVDLRLPSIFDHFSQMSSIIVIVILTICVMVPWVLIFVVVLMPLYFFLDVAVNRSSREAKRMTNTAMSPILTLVQEASNSRLLLRVTGQGPWLLNRTMECLDSYNAAFFVSQSLMGFLRYLGTCIGAFISVALTLILWANPSISEITPGGPTTLGLALTYSFVIPYFLSFLSLFFSMLRLLLASLERLLELKSDLVPQERARNLVGTDPSHAWPSQGQIEFKDATMCYRPGLPFAVKQLSLTIAGGERLGVVGRTGAGKSSLSVLLLRIVELSAGSVEIDGIDVSGIGLQRLRSAVAVVPQDPFLFKGSVAQNLDTFNKLQPSMLTKALEDVDTNLKLEDDVGAGGSQLSSGERQLIAIARATLSTAKIVIMDEPTASCDAQTDSQLQDLVKRAFVNRTVLCIAHRLNTIMTYDRVLVMDAGAAVELDTPDALLADPSTRFAQMVAGMKSSSDGDSPGTKPL